MPKENKKLKQNKTKDKKIMITIQRMEKVNLPLTMEEAESENNNYTNTHNIRSTKLLLIIIAAVRGIHDIPPAFSLSVKVDRIIRISEHFSLNVAYFFLPFLLVRCTFDWISQSTTVAAVTIYCQKFCLIYI